MTKHLKYLYSKKAAKFGGFWGRNYFGLELRFVVDLTSKGLNSN